MVGLLTAGAFGGVARGIVGYLKHQFSYKNVKFEPMYFGLTMGMSALVGLGVSWAVLNYDLSVFGLSEKAVNPAFSFIVGYAGGDFLENVYKTFVGKISFFPHLPKK